MSWQPETCLKKSQKYPCSTRQAQVSTCCHNHVHQIHWHLLILHSQTIVSVFLQPRVKEVSFELSRGYSYEHLWCLYPGALIFHWTDKAAVEYPRQSILLTFIVLTRRSLNFFTTIVRKSHWMQKNRECSTIRLKWKLLSWSSTDILDYTTTTTDPPVK